MQDCEQTQGMSILQHGEMVRDFYLDLKAHVTEGAPLKYEWKLPAWATAPALWVKLLPANTVETYQVFHDCGKPMCREVDQDGRVHFPGHAKVSAQVWRDAGGTEVEARLIEMDMDIHLLKAEGLEEFAARPEAATLLLTGLCEIHANAALFGGIDSTSFKMKWKHIDRRGKQIAGLLA
ncbi:hypothetical protein RBE51_21675 [Pseudomonas taiwanensis]|uniref:hypothetical protein n=1 Tax=Pseudomonas taiwanensis TaxID=470150 RepID=UPI0028DEB3F5|nr:hypothetical protein [Pseudomonas taiwanensis]MDT8925410.1 hypothetical protein [Pseudomonas taiwanensis]